MAVAWNNNSNVKSTKDFLVADKEGNLYEQHIDFDDNKNKLEEKSIKVFHLDDTIHDMEVFK